jgi:prolyl-tRNA synthetase
MDEVPPMKRSQLFTKTRKEAPKDEVAKNAQLLIRAGFVHKEMAGVYTYLPLGLKTLQNIVQIIREEMNAAGGQEMIMTALQDKALWEKTDRWDDEKVDNWFKTNLKSGGEVGLSITHEEPMTRMMTAHVSSYKDLPQMTYQFQNKFRNEMRAKSGIMRGREFMMKDLYSFAADKEGHDACYNAMREAYIKVFKRLGLGDMTYPTFASGGIFSPFSEEFQTVSDAGEDLIYVHEAKGIAVNKEVLDEENLAKLGLKREELVEKKSIEVGNIFTLGTRFSEPLGLMYANDKGEKLPVYMGSYGIGPTRLMGTIVEVLGDEKGIVWPENVAPFKVGIICLGQKDAKAVAAAEALYAQMAAAGCESLYDDRDVSAGEKFADMDLMGLPWQAIIGPKNAAEGKVEWKNRKTGAVQMLEGGKLPF